MTENGNEQKNFLEKIFESTLNNLEDSNLFTPSMIKKIRSLHLKDQLNLTKLDEILKLEGEK